jgi:hypothetical protein
MTFSMTCVIFKLSVNAFYVHMVFKRVTLCVCMCMPAYVCVLRMFTLCLGLKFEVPTELSVMLYIIYYILCTYNS